MSAEPLTGYITEKLLNWLLRNREARATREMATGRYLLSYGLPYRVTAILCGVIFAGFLSLGVIALRDAHVSLAINSALFGAATLFSIYWIHEVLLVRTSFAEDGIQRVGGVGSPVSLPWSGITRVDYSESYGTFCFRGADGQKIRVNLYQSGLGTFAEFASSRMANGPAAGALPMLRQKALNS